MPFDYDSIKCILFRLDPNKRLELFERCPSIRTPDRKTPIKLDKIEFGSSFIQINERKYQLGIIRHYPNVTAPEWVRVENAAGGVQFDVDALAQPRHQVEMTQRKERDRKPSIQEMIENGEAEQKLKELLIESKKSDNCAYQSVLESDIKKLQDSIRSCKEQKAISELKFCNYLLLTKPTDSHRHELVCYAFPIRNYLEYLTEFLLGGRTIYFDNFKLAEAKKGIWPENITIRIAHDFEIQWKDNDIYTIGFPSKKIYFRIAHLQDINIRRNFGTVIFEVKEASMEETIENWLKLYENLIPEQTRRQLIRKQFPFSIDCDTAAHKIYISVEKIRHGKMPITRGDYRIEWLTSKRHPNVSSGSIS